MWVDSSQSRARRLKRAWLAWLVDTKIRRGVLFLTLTFGRNGGRAEAKNAIRRFVDLLRKEYGVKEYFWWAELQKRGVIHYHLVIPDIRFVPKWKLRKMWNRGICEPVWIKNLRDIYFYVLKYVRKLRKNYQADYKKFSKLYAYFRIFGSNRLRSFDAWLVKAPGWLSELSWKMKERPVRVCGGWEFSSFVAKTPWRFARAVSRIGGGWLIELIWVGVRFESKVLV